MSAVIAGDVSVGGVPYNGAIINAFKASRFSGVPAENSVAPGNGPGGAADHSPDAGPVTSGPAFGYEGAFQITVATAEAFYLQMIANQLVGWKYDDSAIVGSGSGVVSVSATNSTIVVAGTSTNPTVAVNQIADANVASGAAIQKSKLASLAIVDADVSTISESKITNLTTDLAAKATNPMTTAGDIITGGSVGAPARLAKGADRTVLTIDPTTHLPLWATSGGAAADGGPKLSVKGASTTNHSISAYSGTTIDGGSVALVSGDRILLKNQTTLSQNGIWIYNGTGVALTRPADFPTGSNQAGDVVFVELGAANLGLGFVLSGASTVTVDTTNQTWTTVGGGGGVQTITAGTNVTISGIFPNLTINAAEQGIMIPTGYICETMPRYAGVSSTTLGAFTSGVQIFFAILLPAGITITKIAFMAGTTALAGGTHQWFSLYSSTGAALAVTTDDTSTAWTGLKTLNIADTYSSGWGASSSYVVTASGLYYLGCMVVASTMPTLVGAATIDALAALAPATVLTDTTNTGLAANTTAPASATFVAPALSTSMAYGLVG